MAFREFHKDREKVKFIDGTWRSYYKSIGYCNYSAHKGHITSTQLREHNCIEKECRYFHPREDRNFLRQEIKRVNQKRKIKDVKKDLKDSERVILLEAKKRFPESKFSICKHLYDNVYILVVLQEELPQNCFSDMEQQIIVKSISKQQEKNILYTYNTLLSDDINQRIRQYKMV